MFQKGVALPQFIRFTSLLQGFNGSGFLPAPQNAWNMVTTTGHEVRMAPPRRRASEPTMIEDESPCECGSPEFDRSITDKGKWPPSEKKPKLLSDSVCHLFSDVQYHPSPSCQKPRAFNDKVEHPPLWVQELWAQRLTTGAPDTILTTAHLWYQQEGDYFCQITLSGDTFGQLY